MSESERNPAPPIGKERGLLCAHCEYLNRQGRTTCEICGHDLFVQCPQCHQQTQRVYGRCQHCGKRFHRGLLRAHHRHHRRHRWSRSLAQRHGISLLSAVLVLLALALAYGLFYLFDQLSF